MGSDPQSHLEAQNVMFVDGVKVTPAMWRGMEERIKSAEDQIARLEGVTHDFGSGPIEQDFRGQDERHCGIPRSRIQRRSTRSGPEDRVCSSRIPVWIQRRPVQLHLKRRRAL